MWKRSYVLYSLVLLLLIIPQKAIAIDSIHIPIQIIIDAGHGGIDGGTSYNNILEKEINLQVAKLLYQELQQKGYVAILNRTGDYALSDENEWLGSRSRHIRDLAQRRHLVKELHPTILVSLHVNWSKNSSANGPVVLYQSKNNQSYTLAQMIQHSLDGFFKTKGVPYPGNTYYLLKQNVCPAVIVEMGFISNSRDRHYLTSPEHQKKIAQSIFTAIEEYILLDPGKILPNKEAFRK
ncbi:N-acetylmuramoyl-L-alanine amidase family protein [Brevibacillus daliensis]|uniref:N-acetylmuramoyl-L-alanine amidase family protein n=1 Tax=Brevibacillus daliensis TaxID=2892995 RepID=UPI001E4D4517|nr:N-acetylmuramoyl-L-alanine amidase [Brevibacillus daliensis]